jgi:hypothetical protein
MKNETNNTKENQNSNARLSREEITMETTKQLDVSLDDLDVLAYAILVARQNLRQPDECNSFNNDLAGRLRLVAARIAHLQAEQCGPIVYR